MALAISGRQVPESEYGTRAYESKDSAYGKPKFKPVQRVMQQITDPYLQYAFTFPPATVTHEGYGVGISEIERPYSIPLVDITGGKALRCSFEFTIAAVQKISDGGAFVLDGITQPIDNEIKLLQDIGNSGVPVEFWNVHPALSIPKWYIDNISFNHSRLNTMGQTTAASCSLSLIEFVPRNKTLILLPRFSYGKFNPTKKTSGVSEEIKKIDEVESSLQLMRATNTKFAQDAKRKEQLRQLELLNTK